MNDPTNNFLTVYLDGADAVTKEVREKNPLALQLLNECVNKIGEQVINWGVLGSAAQQLAFQSQAIFLAAIRTAISGHPAAIHSPLRTALESASYALLVAKNRPETEILWESRHKDKDSLKLHKKTFGPAVELAAVEVGKHQADLEEYLKALYNVCIDFGAHPNPRGLMPHVKKDRGQTEAEYDFVSLYHWGQQVEIGMLFCIEVGIGLIWLLATATKNTALLTPPSTYLNDLMDRKCDYADEIAGHPIEYKKNMYEQVEPYPAK